MTDEAASVVTLRRWILAGAHPSIKQRVFMYGESYGHDKIPDGKIVRTSRIVDCNGRYFTTHSGTLYYLDDPQEGYIRWLESFGYKYDPENPLINE